MIPFIIRNVVSLARATSVKSSVGILTSQGHISECFGNSGKLSSFQAQHHTEAGAALAHVTSIVKHHIIAAGKITKNRVGICDGL